MTRAANRFAAWQEAKQVSRERIIDSYLTYLAKTKVKVRNPTYLADLVAKHITQVEGKSCNKATLLRNVRYKAKLLSFQAQSMAPGVKALGTRSLADPTARALITSSQLESGNLRRELERLKIYVTSLEKQVDDFKSQGRQLPQPSKSADAPMQMPNFELRFVRTCQALRSLISHLNLIIELDTKGQRILDRSKRRNNVIVEPEVAGPFFEWLVAQGR